MQYNYKKYPIEQGNEYNTKKIAKANVDLISSYAMRCKDCEEICSAFFEGCKEICSENKN